MGGMEFGRGFFEGGDRPRDIERVTEADRLAALREFARRQEAEAARIREAEAERLREAEAARVREAEAARIREAERRTIKARPVELTAGRPEHDGVVTVQRKKIDLRSSEVRIVKSRGVLVGDNTRQVNKYQFKVEAPLISVEDLFDRNPAGQRAFADLIQNPDSRSANFAFRRTMRNEALYTGGNIRIEEATGIRVKSVAVHRDSAGQLVIDKSQGVKLGDGSTQLNRFTYRVEQPKFSLEAAMRKDPKLVRDLAVAVGHWDAPAAQHAFEHRLQAACTETSGQLKELRQRYGEFLKIDVTGDGVQLGQRTTRKDRASIHTEKLRLTGWERIKEREERRAEYQKQDQRVREQRQHRIAESRLPGLPAESTKYPGAVSVTPLINRTADFVLGHVAPGREYLAEQMAAEIMTALDNVQQADWREAARLTHAASTARGRPILPRSGQEAPPSLELVELTGSGATGAVVWGSAAAIAGAVGARTLTAEALLCYVRQRMWSKLYDDKSRSVASALRAVEALQAVMFLDPTASNGLWLDVDPARQAHAAALPIRMDLSARPLGRFTVFAQ